MQQHDDPRTQAQTKCCTKCLETKDVSHFPRRSRSKDGLNTWCKSCMNANSRTWFAQCDPERKKAYWKSWRENNPERNKERLREYAITRYGITVAEYEEMRESCDNTCMICGSPPTRSRLSIDHDAETGRVRGLLCDPCNLAIGLLNHDPNVLQQAISYLAA